MQQNLVDQSNNFEDVALNVDTNETQNLELLDAAILQNSSRLKTLSIMSYTSRGMQEGLDSDQ